MQQILLSLLLVIMSIQLLWAEAVLKDKKTPPATALLMEAVRIQGPLDFCGEPVPLKVTSVRERLEKAIMLSVWNQPQVILWMKRAGRYMPIIEKMLKENGMPMDLKYVAVIESALKPHIGSSKGAIGFWQFIRPTAKRYDLTINSKQDDRRNIIKSTRAAIKYFQKLHHDFNNWTLAAAAYNMGEYGLSRAIAAQAVKNFYHLYLPLETQQYILKIIAAKMIFKNPRKYGFYLEPSDYYPGFEFDMVGVKLEAKTHLRVVAIAANTYFKDIKEYNPEIRGDELEAGEYSLFVPKGAAKGFQVRFKKALQTWIVEKRHKRPQFPKSRNKLVYVIQKGDNLSMIAKKFKVSLARLLYWNQLKLNHILHPGKKLVIYLR